MIVSVPPRSHNACVGLSAASGPNDDFRVAAECVEKAKEPVGREPVERALHQGRDFGLVDPEQRASSRLGKPSLSDEIACFDAIEADPSRRAVPPGRYRLEPDLTTASESSALAATAVRFERSDGQVSALPRWPLSTRSLMAKPSPLWLPCPCSSNAENQLQS